MNKKTLEQLEKELTDLKAYHKSAWETYGSELCAGDMIAQEEKLEKEIAKRRQKQKTLKRLELRPSDSPVVETKIIANEEK